MPGRTRRTPILIFLTLLIAQTFILIAQQPARPDSARGAQARDMNNQVLAMYGRLRNLPAGSSTAELQGQAALVIGNRAGVLEALIRENPAEALSFAFSPDLLSALASAFPDSASQFESVDTWEGSVEVTIEDDANMASHRTLYRMSVPGRGVFNLHFAKAPSEDLQSGAKLRVHGVRVRSEIAAEGATVTGSTAGAPVMCPTLGAQKALVLLVNMPGTTPPNISTSSVYDIFFAGSGRSLSGFWRENSYGQAWAEGDVKGWYTLDSNYTCEQYPDIRDAAVRAADADVDFSQYNRVFVIISGIGGGCAWAGIANVGCGSTIQSAEGTFVMSGAWMVSDYFISREQGVRLSIHEAGHGLGLHHASARNFGSEPLGAPGVGGTVDEYGDVLSTMGLWNFGHYAAPHKAQIGWMMDYVTVSASGSFALPPTEQASNIEALKIQRGTDGTKFLWVEFRRNTGLYNSQFAPDTFNGGLIHYEDSTTGARSHLLDFTRSTTSFSDATLKESWTDPYTNLSLSMDTSDSSVLGVTVAYGPVPCVPIEPVVTLSPPNPSVYPGESVNYTITVTNNDSTTCAPATFSLSSSQPSWPTAFSQSLITVAPGMAGSAVMTKTIPNGTVAATYAVDAVASDSGSTAALANVTVKPVSVCAPSAPTVTLSPPDTSGYPGQNLVYTVTVANHDTLVCSPRTFALSSLLPSTWTTVFASNSLTIEPGLAASTTMTKTIPFSASASSYSVNAIAMSGADTSDGTANATVRAVVPVFGVTVSVPSTPVKTNSVVAIAATVTQGSIPSAGATVYFTMQTPSGVVSKKVTSDLSGKALWSYKVSPKGPAGSYTVTAQATSGSQTAISAPSTFVVK
jgi:M6 family metalloprotease-like protein